jgi:hypothetical protein
MSETTSRANLEDRLLTFTIFFVESLSSNFWTWSSVRSKSESQPFESFLQVRLASRLRNYRHQTAGRDGMTYVRAK